jgi:hypothetical protein
VGLAQGKVISTVGTEKPIFTIRESSSRLGKGLPAILQRFNDLFSRDEQPDCWLK